MADAGAATEAPPSGGPDSAVGRIVGALVSPVRTFAAIAKRPTFLAPLVLWTGLSFLVGQLVMPKVDWRAVIAEFAARRDPPLTEAQIDQAAEMQKRISWVREAGFAIVPALFILATAGVIWIGCLAFGWELRFRQAFGITAHAFLPLILSSVVVFALVWNKTTVDLLGMDDVLHSNLGFLVSRTGNPTLHTLVGSVDVLSFWTMALLVLGFSAATRAPRHQVAILVISLWGLYAIGKAGVGMLFS
jgi:hypothetical protein